MQYISRAIILLVWPFSNYFHYFQVHDIAFAPNVGRSYFILGVATNKDLRIISIKNTEDGTKSDQSSKYTVRFTSIVENDWKFKSVFLLSVHFRLVAGSLGFPMSAEVVGRGHRFFFFRHSVYLFRWSPIQCRLTQSVKKYF